MNKNQKKIERRNKIRRRIRAAISGTPECPRLSVYKSSKHVYLQLINDLDNVTITSLSTKSADLQDELKGKSAVESAAILGEKLAQRVVEQGGKNVVFDRSGYKYHGIVKAAAEGARKGGLVF